MVAIFFFFLLWELLLLFFNVFISILAHLFSQQGRVLSFLPLRFMSRLWGSVHSLEVSVSNFLWITFYIVLTESYQFGPEPQCTTDGREALLDHLLNLIFQLSFWLQVTWDEGASRVVQKPGYSLLRLAISSLELIRWVLCSWIKRWCTAYRSCGFSLLFLLFFKWLLFMNKKNLPLRLVVLLHFIYPLV